jgi:hypothetical protein
MSLSHNRSASSSYKLMINLDMGRGMMLLGQLLPPGIHQLLAPHLYYSRRHLLIQYSMPSSPRARVCVTAESSPLLSSLAMDLHFH